MNKTSLGAEEKMKVFKKMLKFIIPGMGLIALSIILLIIPVIAMLEGDDPNWVLWFILCGAMFVGGATLILRTGYVEARNKGEGKIMACVSAFCFLIDMLPTDEASKSIV